MGFPLLKRVIWTAAYDFVTRRHLFAHLEKTNKTSFLDGSNVFNYFYGITERWRGFLQSADARAICRLLV